MSPPSTPDSHTLPPLGPLGRLLLRLSFRERVPETQGEPDPAAAVRDLEDRLPGVVERMRGRRVLDFGCGSGALAVGLAREGCQVVGLDIQERLLRRARELAGDAPARFTDHLDEADFDWIVTVDAMEHFGEPLTVLRTMRDTLGEGGRIAVTFCPTWLSPYGAHMHFFTRVPWVHLLFPERTVMAVRARYVDDGAERYEEVTGGLNRMTVGRFFRLVHEAGLRVERQDVRYVRDLPAARIPLVRELLSSQVSAVLARVVR